MHFDEADEAQKETIEHASIYGMKARHMSEFSVLCLRSVNSELFRYIFGKTLINVNRKKTFYMTWKHLNRNRTKILSNIVRWRSSETNFKFFFFYFTFSTFETIRRNCMCGSRFISQLQLRFSLYLNSIAFYLF